MLLTPIITNWPAQNDVLNIVCDLLMNKRRSFESDHKGKQKSKVNHTSFVVMSRNATPVVVSQVNRQIVKENRKNEK